MRHSISFSTGIRGPGRATLLLAVVLPLLLTIAGSTGLHAKPTGTAETGAGGEKPNRAQIVDEIGQNWVDQIQGNGDAAPNPNGERIGPAPADSADQAEAGDAVEAAEAVETGDLPGATGEGSLRLQNPGAASGDAAGQGEATTGSNTNTPAASEGSGLFPRNEGPTLFSVIFRFFGLMALMVGLFYLGMRYLRSKTGAPMMGGGGDLVQVLVSTPLVQGKFLQIVDVAGRLMVLGVSESGVQMLESIEDGVVADRIRIWQSRRAVNGPLPASLLDQVQNIFKTSDFRFWVSSEDRAKKSPGYASFGELLSGQVPATAGAGSASAGVDVGGPAASARKPAARKKRKQNEDLFSDTQENSQPASRVYSTASVDVPEEQEPDEISLKNLLKQQKRRLASINRNSADQPE